MLRAAAGVGRGGAEPDLPEGVFSHGNDEGIVVMQGGCQGRAVCEITDDAQGGSGDLNGVVVAAVQKGNEPFDRPDRMQLGRQGGFVVVPQVPQGCGYEVFFCVRLPDDLGTCCLAERHAARPVVHLAA